MIQDNLNTAHIDGANVDTGDIVASMMPVIMVSDAEGSVNRNPDYLDTAEATQESGRQRVTYRINGKARWSDGTPITYRDFEANWKARSGKNPTFQTGSRTGYDTIATVTRGATDRDVVITFSSPFGEWKSLFNPLYPASVIQTPQGFNEGYLGKVPVTAGPFKFAGFDKTTKTLSVIRDERWWGEEAMLDRIVFRALDDSATPGAFANGEIDFLRVGVDAAAYKQAQSVPGAQILKGGAPRFRHVTMNGQSPLLRDVRVRTAVARAIDRTLITKSSLQGVDVKPATLGNHFLYPQQEGYKDNSGEVGNFSPEAARKELDAAGWKDAGGVRVKGGKPLELNFLYATDSPESPGEARLVQKMLGDVGIRVKIKPIPGNIFFEKYVNPGNFDLTQFIWVGGAFPVTGGASIYIAPKGKDVQLNSARIGTPQIDTLLKQAGAELDRDEAISHLNAADRLIWQQAAVIPLYQVPEIIASKKTLANLGAQGFATPVYQDIGFTK
ncbi:ABC transporter family substrate-binding protein [Streptomyces sp. NPDC054887]